MTPPLLAVAAAAAGLAAAVSAWAVPTPATSAVRPPMASAALVAAATSALFLDCTRTSGGRGRNNRGLWGMDSPLIKCTSMV
ncbi:exported hypothetical protein [Actinacidiphila bryophytorum]|uniref:Secreted protein n=1 Tax=Actinacidiphila bryophytorum TaxID=1436133 RepID=A0A9W4E3A7_9ACTN|nr:exported hypothetical protein [Actinacidiphila bryophytorum]